jgi:hypothetical protein
VLLPGAAGDARFPAPVQRLAGRRSRRRRTRSA